MTDRKPPTPDDDDELFDRDALNNSDSDFLAELDRVLGENSADSAAEAGHTEADEMSTRIQEPQWGPETEDLEPDTTDRHDSLELELNVADDLLDLSDAASATPASPPSIERAVEAKAPREAMELDWGHLASDNEPAEATAHFEKPTAAPKPAVEKDDFVPLSQDKLAEMQEQMAAMSLPPDEPEPTPRTESSTAPPPSTPAPVAATGSESSAVWSGLVALLALIGIGIGGVAMWQQSQAPAPTASVAAPADGARFAALEQRLSQLETEPAAPTAQPASNIDSQPISVLEQRMTEELERLGGEISDLRNALAQTDGDDAGGSAALDQLGNQIHSLTERLDSMDDRLRGAESAAKKAPAKAAKPAAKAAPKPTAKTPRGNGGWTVNLLSFQRIEKAEQEMARLRGDGIEAQIHTVTSKGKTWHRVVVSGFKNVGDAKAYAQDVRKKPGLSSAWIGRN